MQPASKPSALVKTVACAVALAVCGGCGSLQSSGDQQWTPEGIPLYYTIGEYYDGRNTRWVLDHDGNTVREEERFTVLYDAAGQPQCLVRSYQVPAEGYYGDSDIYRTKDISALYDLDGNLLYDWDEVYYQGGFGDYLIRQNRSLDFFEAESEDEPPAGFETALWNYITGETLLPDVGWVMPMGGQGDFLLTDVYRYAICIVNSAGEIQGEYPLARDYGSVSDVWNDHIIASTPRYYYEGEPPPVYSLLTRSFTVLAQHAYIEGGHGDALLWAYDGEPDTPDWDSFLMTADGERVYQIERGGPMYFDNELCVLDHYNEDEVYRYDLVRLDDGAVLGAGYEILMLDYEREEPAQRFLSYRDGLLCVMDRSGKAVVQRELPGVRYIELYSDGLIRCSIDRGEDALYDLILDSDLNDRMGGGQYRNIMQVTEWMGGGELIKYPLFTAQKWTESSRLSTLDVYDLSGKLVIADLKQVYTAGPDRLAVRKGFEEGLMDWEGNWIVKRSIFSDLRD